MAIAQPPPQNLRRPLPASLGTALASQWQNLIDKGEIRSEGDSAETLTQQTSLGRDSSRAPQVHPGLGRLLTPQRGLSQASDLTNASVVLEVFGRSTALDEPRHGVGDIATWSPWACQGDL
ncbi:hypothetical protein CDL15_Pgr017248 [Punica granatum]|uniref:Uncharacterized protein n=1 Tax=Punica granatum TaxID=22663 RepID=A0A218WT31_PUNGR|nr:hypothetical protein CDL15_Pgr017248 [Punica granatum]PKI55648.1 hypothetical protein CRG98_023959 [Punica granatum]